MPCAIYTLFRAYIFIYFQKDRDVCRTKSRQIMIGDLQTTFQEVILKCEKYLLIHFSTYMAKMYTFLSETVRCSINITVERQNVVST